MKERDFFYIYCFKVYKSRALTVLLFSLQNVMVFGLQVSKVHEYLGVVSCRGNSCGCFHQHVRSSSAGMFCNSHSSFSCLKNSFKKLTSLAVFASKFLLFKLLMQSSTEQLLTTNLLWLIFCALKEDNFQRPARLNDVRQFGKVEENLTGVTGRIVQKMKINQSREENDTRTKVYWLTPKLNGMIVNQDLSLIFFPCRPCSWLIRSYYYRPYAKSSVLILIVHKHD